MDEYLPPGTDLDHTSSIAFVDYNEVEDAEVGDAGRKLFKQFMPFLIDRCFPSPHDPAVEIKHEQRRAGAPKALNMITGDDQKMRELIDGSFMLERIGKRQGLLGTIELELTKLRRRLKRLRAISPPSCLSRFNIDPDRQQEFAA